MVENPNIEKMKKHVKKSFEDGYGSGVKYERHADGVGADTIFFDQMIKASIGKHIGKDLPDKDEPPPGTTHTATDHGKKVKEMQAAQGEKVITLLTIMRTFYDVKGTCLEKDGRMGARGAVCDF